MLRALFLTIFSGAFGCPDFKAKKYAIIEGIGGESIWYGTIKGKHNYDTAEKECQKIRGDSHLAIFKSRADYEHIEEAATKIGVGKKKEFWLSGKGHTSSKMKGHGGQKPYRKWLNHQPDESGGKMNCLSVGNAKWAGKQAGEFLMDDKGCDKKLSVICQIRRFEGCPGDKGKDKGNDQGQKPAEPAKGGGGGAGCFSGNTIVQTKRGQVKIKDLMQSDKVLAFRKTTEVYSDFITWLHYDPHLVADFVQIQTQGNKSISLTENHLLPLTDKCGRIHSKSAAQTMKEYSYGTADSVRPGMCLLTGHNGRLVEESVVEVTRYTERGVYAPLTSITKFFTNGILTSCYSDGPTRIQPHDMGLRNLMLFFHRFRQTFGHDSQDSFLQDIVDRIQYLLLIVVEKATHVM